MVVVGLERLSECGADIVSVAEISEQPMTQHTIATQDQDAHVKALENIGMSTQQLPSFGELQSVSEKIVHFKQLTCPSQI